MNPDFKIPQGYRLLKVGDKIPPDSYWCQLSLGSTDLTQWNKHGYHRGDDVVLGVHYPRITLIKPSPVSMLPSGYELVTDPDYVVKKGDYYYGGGKHAAWVSANSSVGKKYGYLSCVEGSYIAKPMLPTPPSGYEVVTDPAVMVSSDGTWKWCQKKQGRPLWFNVTMTCDRPVSWWASEDAPCWVARQIPVLPVQPVAVPAPEPKAAGLPVSREAELQAKATIVAGLVAGNRSAFMEEVIKQACDIYKVLLKTL